jgi:hypothetical protein
MLINAEFTIVIFTKNSQKYPTIAIEQIGSPAAACRIGADWQQKYRICLTWNI